MALSECLGVNLSIAHYGQKSRRTEETLESSEPGLLSTYSRSKVNLTLFVYQSKWRQNTCPIPNSHLCLFLFCNRLAHFEIPKGQNEKLTKSSLSIIINYYNPYNCWFLPNMNIITHHDRCFHQVSSCASRRMSEQRALYQSLFLPSEESAPVSKFQ